MTKRIRAVSAFLVLVLMLFNMNIYFADSEENEIILPVLMYHNIAEEYSEEATGANITPELFREHMQGILDRGYTPIFVADYYNFILSGTPLPENPIAVTFDDGYLSNYELAYPILKEMNIPATIFVVTKTVGAVPEGGLVSNPHFTWEQAKEMQESGIIDIHSHTHTHRDLSALTVSELQMELRLSKYLIEKNLGKNCFIFAYPYGGYDNDTFRMAKYAGYRMQILVNNSETNEDYLANKASDGFERFTRLTVSGDMSVEDLYKVIDLAVKNTMGNQA